MKKSDEQIKHEVRQMFDGLNKEQFIQLLTDMGLDFEVGVPGGISFENEKKDDEYDYSQIVNNPLKTTLSINGAASFSVYEQKLDINNFGPESEKKIASLNIESSLLASHYYCTELIDPNLLNEFGRSQELNNLKDNDIKDAA